VVKLKKPFQLENHGLAQLLHEVVARGCKPKSGHYPVDSSLSSSKP
jgi:hypothetical protein